MDNTLKTKFKVSLWNVWRMRDEADQIAIDMGFEKDSLHQDAFRHAYVSAKMQEAYGEIVSQEYGSGNEAYVEISKRVFSGGERGNPENSWKMDEFNNAGGRYIEKAIAEKGLEGEKKEYVLRQVIAEGVREGGLQTDPKNPPFKPPHQEVDLPVGASQDSDPTVVLEGESEHIPSEEPNSWWNYFFGNEETEGKSQPETQPISLQWFTEEHPDIREMMKEGRKYREKNNRLDELFSRNWRYEQERKEKGVLIQRQDHQRWMDRHVGGGNGGDVKVSAYNRSTGGVRAHTRSKADGDISNNFSFRKKG